MTYPLTVVIPTYNEELNLPFALRSVQGWAEQIVVVDSYSKDRTLEIAQSFGAEIYQHSYENMAAQRMWAIQHPGIRHEWVLNLDADEQVTEELKAEIDSVLNNIPNDIGAFMMRRKHIFLGRWMKYGGDYIWLTRLVRRDRCRIVKAGLANEHTIIHGRVLKLRHALLHINQKPFTGWIERQNRGSQKFVLKIFEDRGKTPALKLEEGEHVEGCVRTWLNYHVFAKVPLWLRPFVRFVVNYFFRGGFLDGWQGFAYHVTNDFFVHYLVWAKYKELEQSEPARRFAREAKWR